MIQPPFSKSNELYHNPNVAGESESQVPVSLSPAEERRTKNYLPGQPRIILESPELGRYVESEVATDELDRLSPHLWLVAKQDSSHISSLTHQIVRGRSITITEQPRLHLVWFYDRVYIKPIPKYLLSYDFWAFYLIGNHSPILSSQRENINKAAIGFLRSYSYLIQHKSDFILAKEQSLIPKCTSYHEFVNFIQSFLVNDGHVSPRYQFGELRLTRLNFWSKIFLRRFTYYKVYGQYGAYFGRFYGPLLFVFATFTVVLSAMQVALTVPSPQESGGSWEMFGRVSRWFSVATILCVAAMGLLLLLALVVLCSRELIYAIYHLNLKKGRENINEMEDIGESRFSS